MIILIVFCYGTSVLLRHLSLAICRQFSSSSTGAFTQSELDSSMKYYFTNKLPDKSACLLSLIYDTVSGFGILSSLQKGETIFIFVTGISDSFFYTDNMWIIVPGQFSRTFHVKRVVSDVFIWSIYSSSSSDLGYFVFFILSPFTVDGALCQVLSVNIHHKGSTSV